MSKYPRDEFDKVPEKSARQGVHRERLIPSRSGSLALIITVGLLALVLGIAAYFVLPRLGIGADDAALAAAPNSSATAESSEPQASEPAPAKPSEAPDASSAPAGPAVADRAQPVVILNGSGIAGLGTSVSARMAAEGWSGTEVANWSGQLLQESVIFYSGEDQLPGAGEVSQLLGIPTISESPEFSAVTVAIGPGFQ